MKMKDFNEIQLESAMLKENYEGSSNPSSMNTMQTGKRSLKDRRRKKLADSIYGGACKCISITKIQIQLPKSLQPAEKEVVQKENKFKAKLEDLYTVALLIKIQGLSRHLLILLQE